MPTTKTTLEYEARLIVNQVEQLLMQHEDDEAVRVVVKALQKEASLHCSHYDQGVKDGYRMGATRD